jgi:DNA-binding transcriptional LysR family regulator
MPASISIGALRALIVTARIKSLSGAAQELGIPRRSLIHVLRKLERQLDVPLFGWGQDWVDLTTCGVIFVERVTLVLEIFRRAMVASPQEPPTAALPPSCEDASDRDL